MSAAMMKESDTDGDGFISLAEFVDLNTSRVDPAAAMEDLRHAFSVFDLDRNGSISAEELASVLQGIGEEATVAQCRKMIRGVDQDGDGVVSFEEFRIMMTRGGSALASPVVTRSENCSGDVLMNNSLVDAFAKCGSIDMARQVFDRMPTRDIASWNVMISGLVMHECVKQSLHVFHRMVKNWLKPSPITFVGILSACNHGSLVTEGQKHYDAMVGQFGIESELEHYGCMVDLLARTGCIDEVLDMVLNRMSCKSDAMIWRSLVDACCKRNAGVLVSEAMARRAIELDSVDSSGAYVLLSRVYALAIRWDEVGLVRKLISEGVWKEPGCSTIEMDGIVHGFVVGDTSDP